MVQVDQIKTHWLYARSALSKATTATTAADRQAYAAEAQARIEAVRMLWSWPDKAYEPLP